MSFMRVRILLIIGSLVACNGALLQIEDAMCKGVPLDLYRQRKVSKDDLPNILNRNGDWSLAAREIHPVTVAGSSECVAERHRMRPTVSGVPVFGSDIVVTIDGCTEATEEGVNMIHSNSIMGVSEDRVQSVRGEMYDSVNEPRGFIPDRTVAEASEALKKEFRVDDIQSQLNLEILPSILVDYLAYVGTILIPDDKNDRDLLVDVAVDAHNLEILLRCERPAFIPNDKRRRLRSEPTASRTLEDDNCTSGCALSPDGVEWSTQITSCPMETLYSNNTDSEASCRVGVIANSTEVYGPAEVSSLSWGQMTDCQSKRDKFCRLTPFASCADAAFDVQYHGVKFMQFLNEEMGMKGGLAKSRRQRQKVTARVHYRKKFCNAFYFWNMITFGDCDCNEYWGPLVSADIVAHEIAHGVTEFSSSLIYIYEMGGLNEAYSDIIGTAFEFYMDDNYDKPDFILGEQIGEMTGAGVKGPIRNMEDPIGDSIGHYCKFEHDMNVHYSSGILNRAYVKATKSCAQSSCGGDLRECAIYMAKLFAYTNLETLTMSSSYNDAASMTCQNIREFRLAFPSDTITCSGRELREYVNGAFRQVGLVVDDDCNVSNICGIAFNAKGFFRYYFYYLPFSWFIFLVRSILFPT